MVVGAPTTIGNAELVLAACIVPPLVVLRVWHAAAPLAAAVATHTMVGHV
jgi:hypothetical protein